jgi:hypothetical protein
LRQLTGFMSVGREQTDSRKPNRQMRLARRTAALPPEKSERRSYAPHDKLLTVPKENSSRVARQGNLLREAALDSEHDQKSDLIHPPSTGVEVPVM